jgi:hypothetical protein
MFTNILAYAKREYGWDEKYAQAVLTEYERFMYIKSLDLDTSPTDPIDQLWHTHILYTELYLSYCKNKFGKFIHHNPDMSLDQKSRLSRIAKTIKIYSKIYTSITHPEIWNINTELVGLDNCVNTQDSIHIKIVYRMVNSLESKYSLALNNQILSIGVTPNTTYQDLINFISKKTSHPSVAIRGYPTDKTYKAIFKRKTDGLRVQINNYAKINLNLSKYYIFELEEMTSNGYC